MPKLDIQNIDRLFHFIEYFVLGFLLVRAFFHSFTDPNFKYIFIAAVAISCVYGASDEFHQRFVAGRSCDIIDLVSDLAGSLLGAGLCLSAFASKKAIK